MNKFEKVGFGEFVRFLAETYGMDVSTAESIKTAMGLFDNVKKPERKTLKSAGYDIATPIDVELSPGASMIIPTGVKCQMDDDAVLMVFPRSSMGFKHHMMLANTVGIIDADYYGNKSNEGHIMIKIVNNGDHDIKIEAGDAFCQGVILKYYITEDDEAYGTRVGGIGSTDAE